MKIYYFAGDRTPDSLNQRQTCYHLSKRGGLRGKRQFQHVFVKYYIYSGDAALQVRETPERNLTRKLVPIGVRTRVRWVTDAHTIACPQRWTLT